MTSSEDKKTELMNISISLNDFLSCDNVERLKTFIIEKKINVNEFLDNAGNNLLYAAASNNALKCAEYLIKSGMRVDIENHLGVTALFRSSDLGFLKMCVLLLKLGANPNKATTYNKNTPLIVACQNGYSKIAEVLIAYGADINLCNVESARAFSIICDSSQGNEELLYLFINNENVNVNEQNDSGMTPLMHSVTWNRIDFIKELLRKKADSNIEDSNGWNALMWACHFGHIESAETLLEHTNPLHVSKTFESPLSIYLKNEYGFFVHKPEFVEKLIERIGMNFIDEYVRLNEPLKTLLKNKEIELLWNKCYENCRTRERVKKIIGKKEMEDGDDLFNR